VIVDPNASETLDGFATRKGYVGTRVTLVCDGTGWRTVSGYYRYFSGDQSITAGGTLTLPHGLGVRPRRVWGELRCITTEGNYSAGDIVSYPESIFDGVSPMSWACTPDGTNLNARLASTAQWRILNKTSGASLPITATNWRVRLYAED